MKKRDFIITGITMLIMCIPLVIIAKKYQQAVIMQTSAFDWKDIKPKPTKYGEGRKFFQAPTATLDELECHVTTLNPGLISHPPHQHPDEEVVIIKEGTLEAFLNGETKTVGPGSVLFFAANQLHGVKNIGTKPAIYHVFKWQSSKTGKAMKAK